MQRVIPLIVLVAMLALLAFGLTINPTERKAENMGQPAPQFSAPLLGMGTDVPVKTTLSSADLKGKVWVLNAWATWCGSCRAEHQALNEMAKDPAVLMVGLNYKDNVDDAQRFLQAAGNPYTYVLVDKDGKLGFKWGLSYTPTTVVIDKQNRVRYAHVGELKLSRIKDEILPLIRELQHAK